MRFITREDKERESEIESVDVEPRIEPSTSFVLMFPAMELYYEDGELAEITVDGDRYVKAGM